MTQEATNFTEARQRLEEIVKQVRSKEVSLEKSLDLFDEAIKVGNNCFELIDQADFSEEETGETADPKQSDEGRGEGTEDDSPGDVQDSPEQESE